MKPQHGTSLLDDSVSLSTRVHLVSLVSAVTLLLLFCSSIRHALFESAIADLGIFDQYAYLISQGLPPISSFLNFHVLGDHAAYSFYLVGGLYKIWTNVHLLFILQALALALGVIPVFFLALQVGASEAKAITLSYVYLLYPLIFNINLFDFHPEVMALPTLLGAIWLARQGKKVGFLVCILFVVGCKAVLSLTLVGMGLWLLIWERRRFFGGISLAMGIAWFLVATQVVIPHFRPFELSWFNKYDPRLGNSIFEIAWSLIQNPFLIPQYIFTPTNLGYIVYLVFPLIWGFAPGFLAPLIGGLPILLINLISVDPAQKDLIYQYSLPILPFMMVVVIDSFSKGKSFLRHRTVVLAWSLIGFLALAKYSFFWGGYLDTLDTWQASRMAISNVVDQRSLLTTLHLAPHLTHRVNIQALTPQILEDDNFAGFDQILIDARHPGKEELVEVADALFAQLKVDPRFEQRFLQDGVYLFAKPSQL